MRLKDLSADNALSFDHFEMDLDPSRTVVVGPNGSGKTNLTRLLALIGSALEWVEMEGPRGPVVAPGSAAQVLDGFARARHVPDAGGPQAVRLGFELTTDRERDLLVAFARAAVLWSLREGMQGDQHIGQLADWVMTTVTAEACADLFSGILVAEHPGVRDRFWDVSFEFTHGSPSETYRWILQAPNWHSTILTAHDASASPPGLSADTGILAQRLLGFRRGDPPPTSLPPLQPFVLDLLCPAPGEAVRLVVGSGGTYVDLGAEPYRAFFELGHLRRPVVPAPGYTLATVLHQIYGAGLVPLGEQLRGVGAWGAAQPAAGHYSWDDLATPSLSRQPHLLPLRLFRLKTGSAADRHQYQQIQRAFTTLAPERHFDVTFEAAPGQSNGSDEVGVAEARINVMVTKLPLEGVPRQSAEAPELPIQFHGAGTWEGLLLAEALNDAAGRVVVLDEPATTLHPSWQRGLGTQLDQSEGQLLLITHSPDLVRIRQEEDLARLVRLSAQSGATVARRLARHKSRSRRDKLVRGLALSAELRSCLFAKGVVLLEGETELGALPGWLARCAAAAKCRTPEALDLAFYSVGGDTGFAAPLMVLVALGIPWVVICDGAAFDATRTRDHIFAQVSRAGGEDLRGELPQPPAQMDEETFGRLVAVGRTHGILTLASGWTLADKQAGTAADESFEAYVHRVDPDAQEQARATSPGSEVRQGLWLAENVAPPEGIDDLYRDCVRALRLRGLSA